jgi:hypothetical protein
VSFQYTSGDPSHLTGGANASMADIQGPFTDLKTFLNNRIAAVPTLVAALPVSPVDAQEIYYLADSTNGVIWHLRYRAASASAYKWEWVGGGFLRSFQLTAGTTGTGSAYSNQLGDGTGASSIVAPLSGDYWCEHYANASHGVDATSINVSISVEKVASLASPTSTASPSGPVSTGHSNGSSTLGAMAAAGPLLAVSAGNWICQMYLFTSKNPTTYQQRILNVRPIRVG